MLEKIPKATAVVSILLVTITIALTLTLTVSAAEAGEIVAKVESTSTKKITTTTTGVVSEYSNVSNGTATTIAETTTTTFLTLQPPSFDVAAPTTASNDFQTELLSKEPGSDMKNSINHKIKETSSVAVSGDKQRRDETKEQAGNIELNTSNATGAEDFERTQFLISNSANIFQGIVGQGFRLPAQIDENHQNSTLKNQTGFIEFEHPNSLDIASEKKQKRTETVNEVLSSLFPNGFSDIFRFSYASEQQTKAQHPATTTAAPSTKMTSRSNSSSKTSFIPTTTAATTAKITTIPSSRIISKPSFSYTTSISKQYRRLVSPGHEEIVVEKLAPPVSSEEFRDGSNSISKSDLLRINRAAAEAPVLPSLLLNPVDAMAAKNSTSKAPIIILKEHSSEQYDIEDEIEDDNQIAESQDIAQHIFQRFPNANRIPSDGQQQAARNFAQKIDETDKNSKASKQTQKRAFGQRLFTPAAEIKNEVLFGKVADKTPTNLLNSDQPASQQQDHYQQEAEKFFVQPSAANEAPSRQFLKHFNPQLSESLAGLVKKGNFHYELQQEKQRLTTPPATSVDYDGYSLIQPAAQLEYQREKLNEYQHQSDHALSLPSSKAHSDYRGYGEPQEKPLDESSPQNGVVFVTLNTPMPRITPIPTSAPILSPELPGKTPHEYVSEAVGAASQRVQQQLLSSPEPKSNAGYTFVEVQKSVNIHNKLITEKDGQLVEQHETIYHQPQYAQNIAEVTVPQPSPKEYVSLSENPINVQQIDSEDDEIHEEAASHHSHQTYQGPAPPPPPPPPPPPENEVQVIEKIVPQTYPIPAIFPVHEIVEKFVDRPYPVEKIVDRPVKIPYPVHVDRYVDRPYPVHEIIETHVPVPYPVPEPVAVPVAVEHYIDRPYPVETVVEKRIAYPVEKVVEKVVEKHIPVEKIVEKIVDRPIAIPIHVPVAVPIRIGHTSTGYGHPNAVGWVQQEQLQAYKIPQKVLQNYYSRMLKKLFNPKEPSTENSPTPRVAPNSNKAAQPKTPIQFTKPPFKISDIRYDLKPPPAPLGPSWSKGARYMYKTLPKDLSKAGSSNPKQKQEQYVGLLPPDNFQAYDELSSWRYGNLLKRSPDFGRNLHIEYGFKPPLVPSVEIDDKGVPLTISEGKNKE